MIQSSKITITASDDVLLTGTHFVPDAPVRGAVLVVCAMGVPQVFYARLAEWMAGLGFHVLTFDFRGTGASRRGSLRELETDILKWARFDATAALRTLKALAPGVPLIWLGHSLGGQIVPFVDGHRDVDRIITIAAGSGYWRENAPALRRKVWLLWFFVAPLAVPLFGYFPGQRLRMVGDLPKGVIQQWRRWCLNPRYAVGVESGAAEQFAQVRSPLTSISFTDDEMMSEQSIRSLLVHFVNAPISVRRLRPDEVGASRVGHFGFFRDPKLWVQVLQSVLLPTLLSDSRPPDAGVREG